MTLANEDIIDWLEQLEKESKALRDEVLRVCWYMRGSISYDEGMCLSSEDRALISELIKDNLETAKKSGMPFF